MVMAVAKAAESGARAVVCASTGNTSASAAAYAAAAGLEAIVLLPAGKIAAGKLLQAFAAGAKVISIDGNFDDALEIARKNNPAYLQSITGRTRAVAAVRAAYGALLPSADASFGTSYREGRPQFFGGVAFGATSDIIASSWNLGANARLSYNSLNTIRRANG